ncbi:retrotransposon protein, putative, ty1-copia subclass [Tanacetum coccineum]
MLDSESNKWIDAMNAEIQFMMDNMVWVLVDLPPGCKTVRSKWIFKKKTDIDGIVHVYKARLVAKGYTQLYGVDYEEMFSPVADIRAIRNAHNYSSYYDYEIWKWMINTTFLKWKVCKLQRSIYGLKQASRNWNKRFDEKIKRTDVEYSRNIDKQFQQNPGDLHWYSVEKNILKYLRNTKDMFLVYGGNPSTELRVECYCNAGFETDIDDMKSLTTEA